MFVVLCHRSVCSLSPLYALADVKAARQVKRLNQMFTDAFSACVRMVCFCFCSLWRQMMMWEWCLRTHRTLLSGFAERTNSSKLTL